MLSYPEGFQCMTGAERSRICNGAGAANGFKVPSTMYGLNLMEIFDIHDYEYHFGKTIEDKELSDRRMLNNGLRLINSAQGLLNKLLAPLRRRRLLKYYEAVHYFGGPAFWAGKN